MEAALVLTCLGGAASPAPPAYANVQAHPAKTTHQVPQGQNDGVQRTTSTSSDDDQAAPTDLAPIYSSSDGYDGSAEEDGNKSPEPAYAEDISNNAGTTSSSTAPAPRRFLKGGKRGKSTSSNGHSSARSSSPWGSKAKNLADAALEQYQATATEAAQAAPSSSTTSSSKSRFRTSLKRTNSKTRMKWQAS